MAIQETSYNRLFTVGCSYTNYSWPTYSAFLASVFKKTYNYGASGAGNNYIFNTTCKLINDHNVGENDAIVVQWTGIGRLDEIIPKGDGYSFYGNLDWCDVFSWEWLTKHHNVAQLGYDYIHYIQSLAAIAKVKGIKLVFTNMLDPTISLFYGEPAEVRWHKPLRGYIEEFFPKDKIKQVLLENNFLTSIEEFTWRYPKKKPTYLFTDDGAQGDDHPSPIQHLKYAQYIAQELGFNDNVRIFWGETYEFAEIYEDAFTQENIDIKKLMKGPNKEYFTHEPGFFVHLQSNIKAIRKHLAPGYSNAGFKMQSKYE